MAYSTVDDLQQALGGFQRLVQATDWNDDGVPDDDVVARAIASADGEIDSYVNKQYLVPLAAPVPQIVTEVSARIAKFRLAVARGMLDQFIRDEHEEDVKWLASLRDGDNSLGVEPVPTASSMRVDAMTERSTLKDVSRFKLRGFI